MLPWLHACQCFRGWLLCRGKTGLVNCMKRGFDSVHERPRITARWLLALRHSSQPASSPPPYLATSSAGSGWQCQQVGKMSLKALGAAASAVSSTYMDGANVDVERYV